MPVRGAADSCAGVTAGTVPMVQDTVAETIIPSTQARNAFILYRCDPVLIILDWTFDCIFTSVHPELLYDINNKSVHAGKPD